jgi:hypothetical protein
MKFLETDFLSLALAKYREIPKEYVRSFVIIFIAINVAFAYHTFSFMWGDHDWNLLINSIDIHYVFEQMRFTNYIYVWFLVGNNVLPVLNNLYSFAALAFSAVFLCIYWKVPKSTLCYSIIGILLCIQPYTLAWLQYAVFTLSLLCLPLFVIVAIIFSERAALCDKRWKVIAYLSCAVFLTTVAFGAYSAQINTIAVVFIGRLIIDVFRGEGGIFVILKGVLFRQRYVFLTMVLSALCYVIIILILKNNYAVNTTFHGMQTVNIKDFIPHLMNVSYEAFRILWHYTVSFFPKVLVRIWTSLFIVGVFAVIFNVWEGGRDKKTKIGKSIVLLILFASIIIFSKTAGIISSHPIALYDPRILFFGDAFLHIFPLTLIFLQRFNFPKTIAVLTGIILIGICLIQDAKALKVWKFDFEAEKMFWNRVMTRVEENEDYNANKKYRLLFVGKPPSYARHYYGNKNRSDEEIKFAKKVGAPITIGMLRSYEKVHPMLAFSFFFPDLYKAQNVHARYVGYPLLQNLRYRENHRLYKQAQPIKEIALKLKTQINGMRAYPHKNSVLIKDGVIIIVFSESELKAVKKILNK